MYYSYFITEFPLKFFNVWDWQQNSSTSSVQIFWLEKYQIMKTTQLNAAEVETELFLFSVVSYQRNKSIETF